MQLILPQFAYKMQPVGLAGNQQCSILADAGEMANV
jgi:hypothetical protein